MQLKITTDYAIRMILYLAQNESVIVSATEIAQAMKIPHSYLIQSGAVLKKSGLTQAHSGRLGGLMALQVNILQAVQNVLV